MNLTSYEGKGGSLKDILQLIDNEHFSAPVPSISVGLGGPAITTIISLGETA